MRINSGKLLSNYRPFLISNRFLFFLFFPNSGLPRGGVVQQVSQDRSDHVHTSASAMSESFTAFLRSHRPTACGWLRFSAFSAVGTRLGLSPLPPGCLMSVQATHPLCFLSARQSSPDSVFPEIKHGNWPYPKLCAAPRASPDPDHLFPDVTCERKQMRAAAVALPQPPPVCRSAPSLCVLRPADERQALHSIMKDLVALQMTRRQPLAPYDGGKAKSAAQANRQVRSSGGMRCRAPGE